MSQPDQAYCDKFYNRTADLIKKYQPDLIYFDDDALPLWPVSDAGLKIAADFYNRSMAQHDGKLEAVILGKQLNDVESQCIVWDIERGTSDRIEPLPVEDGHLHRQLASQPCGPMTTTAQEREPCHQRCCRHREQNGDVLLNMPVHGDGTI